MNELREAINYFMDLAFKTEQRKGKDAALTMLCEKVIKYAHLAERALREKAEREKGCEWCGVKKLEIPIMYNGEECGKAWLYEADDGWALFLEYNGEIDYVDVSSCPNCGRKLKED